MWPGLGRQEEEQQRLQGALGEMLWDKHHELAQRCQRMSRENPGLQLAPKLY